MGTNRSYKELIAWQKAMDLVSDVYSVSQEFPRDEIYGLTSQVRRAAVSIPSNIAEGQGRRSPKEFVQFLRIARGSIAEVETQLLIAVRLGYTQLQRAEMILDASAELGRVLQGLMASQLR
jgi:four helix bundle protein